MKKITVILLVVATIFINIGCAAIPLVVGAGAGVAYKASHKQCPYCKSWMEKDAVICGQCGKDYPADGKIPEGYGKSAK